MQPRREPLLWLQCLAIGAIPLELLLIRVLLAGADPGPVPLLERLLLWGVAVLAPAVALWRRPADWGSLLLLRSPVASRSQEQLHYSAMQEELGIKVGLAVVTVVLLPLIWWLDESAGLLQEFSPLQDQSRLVSLLLSAPGLALVVWQAQQLLQALLLLSRGTVAESPEASWDCQRIKTERSSFGLQLLQLQPLVWPEAMPKTDIGSTPEPAPTAAGTTDTVKDGITSEKNRSGLSSEETDTSEQAESAATEVELIDTRSSEAEPETEESPKNEPEPATSDSVLLDAAVAIEPEQGGEEQEGASLDAEVVEGDTVASGEAEQHREQSEAGGGEEGEPDEAPQSTPGGL